MSVSAARPWREEIRSDGTRVDAAGVVVRRGRMTFDEIEAARVARLAGPARPPVPPPTPSRPSSPIPWAAKFRDPFPSDATTRAPRTCGVCGSREHDRRNHGRVVEQETPTGILLPAPPALTPPIDPPPAAAAEPDPAPLTVRVQDRAREVAIQRGNGRALTVSPHYGVTKAERRSFALAVLSPDEEASRPRTREECKDGPRPCPWVSCSHHLYLDVNPETGSLKLNFPRLEVWEMAETCSLDVADRGGITLEEVGAILNLTRERIRQVETRGLDKMRLARPDLTEPDTHGPASFNRFAIEVP